MEPSFIIIGEARSGTTSLFNYLCQHDRVLSPLKKEIHYFDYKYNKGLTWYKSFFPKKAKKYITGEATPYYFSHPKAAERLKEKYPNMKIILILRNPVDRVISSYYKQRSLNIEPVDTIEKALELEEVRLKNSVSNIQNNSDFDYYHKNFAYCLRGMYYDNLLRWHNHFKKDQILIFEFEELYQNIEINFERILQFLNLEKQEINFEHFNKGNYNTIDPELRNKLNKVFEESNRNTYRFLGSNYNWN